MLNGEPGEFAELPGVTRLSGPHVLVGAPGWPVVGFCIALAEIPVVRINVRAQNVTAATLRRSLPMSNLQFGRMAPPAFTLRYSEELRRAVHPAYAPSPRAGEVPGEAGVRKRGWGIGVLDHTPPRSPGRWRAAPVGGWAPA